MVLHNGDGRSIKVPGSVKRKQMCSPYVFANTFIKKFQPHLCPTFHLGFTSYEGAGNCPYILQLLVLSLCGRRAINTGRDL